MAKIRNILVIANSARMLVQSAVNDDFSPLAIDCFADKDTQGMALDFVKVTCLALSNVLLALSILSKRHTITHVVYGSGFENYLSTLKYLQQNFIVLGNSFKVFSSIQQKTHFFLQLAQQHIVYPETSFQPPDEAEGWLIKPLKGEGGIGIQRYSVKQETESIYWQKFCAGTAQSVLFLANASEYKIIGFHKQYTAQIYPHDFVFSGLINQPDMDESIVQTLHAILSKLVPLFSLKGVNSLDFILNNQQCYMLEINARPSASVNLYGSGLFLAHINSCLESELLSNLNALASYRAYKIIFAETEISIPERMVWPAWVVDIPSNASIINTGMPICSIIAGGKNEQQVDDLLLLRQQQLIKLLR